MSAASAALIDEEPIGSAPVVIRLRAARRNAVAAAGTVLPAVVAARPTDRRTHPRRSLAELPWLDVVRIKYGPTITLIDLSAGGAQIETIGHRLQPNSTIVVQFGSHGGIAVAASVLRCQVRGFSPHPIYRGAVAFKQPLDITRDLIAAAPEADADPVREHARLVEAFRRWAAALGAPAIAAPDLATDIDDDELAVALAALQASRDPDQAGPLGEALISLFRMAIAACEQRVDCATLSSQILDYAWRTVPERATRPWHHHYLTAAAHLISSVRRVGMHTGVEAAASESSPAAPPHRPTADVADNTIAGWNRVVVRFVDGRLLKGFSRDFIASSSHLHVWPQPSMTDASRATVALDHVKAVFFVRDFAGSPEYVENPEAAAGRHGRRVAVTFADGETLVGTTLNYSAASRGFFINPVDDRSNNTRVFVAKAAVQKVQFR